MSEIRNRSPNYADGNPSNNCPGVTSTAFASRSTVDACGSRFPASIRLISPVWTPLRSPTCSWVSPSRSRAARRLGPRAAMVAILCPAGKNLYGKFRKSSDSVPSSPCRLQTEKGRRSGPKCRGQIGPSHALGYECLTICTVETTCGTLAICMAPHLPLWVAPSASRWRSAPTVEKF